MSNNSVRSLVILTQVLYLYPYPRMTRCPTCTSSLYHVIHVLRRSPVDVIIILNRLGTAIKGDGRQTMIPYCTSILYHYFPRWKVYHDNVNALVQGVIT